eukprot:SAG11_NODE_3486_length_2418_cov_3.728762_1_plen_113_part_00
MMMNLGIRQFQVKCGFGNAMVMELRDVEDVNEMLGCADNFMEQTVEPEGTSCILVSERSLTKIHDILVSERSLTKIHDVPDVVRTARFLHAQSMGLSLGAWLLDFHYPRRGS